MEYSSTMSGSLVNDMLLKAKTTEEAKEALAKGANINARDRYRTCEIYVIHEPTLQTPLMYAITLNREYELIKLLIEAGADVNLKDKAGDTALMIAITLNREYELIKLLIEAGADVNATNEDGHTALMNAGTAEQTKLLLEAGADVNATDKDGHTALMNARTAEQTKLLLEAGADVNATDKDGYTALMNARTAEQTKLLLEAGADVNAVNEMGNSALILAHGIEQKKLLVEAGAHINVKFHSGIPLLKAETAEETKLLLEAGADVNMGYSYRRGNSYTSHGPEHHITALSEAKDEAQALLLLKAGADIEGFQENNNISFKQKIEIVEKFRKEQQIESQKGHLQKRQEYIAERKGEKISSPSEPTTHDSNSSTSLSPKGRDDGGR